MRTDRLRKLVQAVRECARPEKFTLDCWRHACGTPACPFGQYVARPDLQSAFEFQPSKMLTSPRMVGQPLTRFGMGDIAEHFEIPLELACSLFSKGGCGGATTPEGAARHIETIMREYNWRAGAFQRRHEQQLAKMMRHVQRRREAELAEVPTAEVSVQQVEFPTTVAGEWVDDERVHEAAGAVAGVS